MLNEFAADSCRSSAERQSDVPYRRVEQLNQHRNVCDATIWLPFHASRYRYDRAPAQPTQLRPYLSSIVMSQHVIRSDDGAAEPNDGQHDTLGTLDVSDDADSTGRY